MHWSFRETSKASAAVLYIIFCEILPYCLLATVYMLWYIICVCTLGIVCLPFHFYGSSIRSTADYILGASSSGPIWLGQKLGLSTLMISPLDRNYIPRYRKYRAEKESLRYEPAPLPRARKRRLSDGRKASQLNSSFLNKLPLEIRQTIYKEVVIGGSEHRHIIELPSRTSDGRRKKNQLWGASCIKQPDSKCWTPHILTNGANLCRTSCRGYDYLLKPKNGCYGALELAKTCRQIYLEVINIFYS